MTSNVSGNVVNIQQENVVMEKPDSSMLPMKKREDSSQNGTSTASGGDVRSQSGGSVSGGGHSNSDNSSGSPAIDETNSNSDEGQNQDGSPSGKFASIFTQGPSFSVGSADHPDGCQPCVHFCYSKRRGCNRGDACTYCHSLHESKLQQKRMRWKGNKKEVHQQKKQLEQEALQKLARDNFEAALQQHTRDQPQVIQPLQPEYEEKSGDNQFFGDEPRVLPKLAYAETTRCEQPRAPKLAYTRKPFDFPVSDPMRIPVPGRDGSVASLLPAMVGVPTSPSFSTTSTDPVVLSV